MEVVYKLKIQKKDEQQKLREKSGKHLGIDIGISNLMAVGNNFGAHPFLINGKGLKSTNQDFNRRLAKAKAIVDGVNAEIVRKEQAKNVKIRRQYLHKRKVLAKKSKRRFYTENDRMEQKLQKEGKLLPKKTRRMDTLYRRREFRIMDGMHKASRMLVRYASEQGVDTIVIGKNEGWKQETKLCKKVAQTFVQIPFAKLIELIEYKARLLGIEVITHEESFTSGTSFLDGELPTREFYNKSRRNTRGLFHAGDGLKINADINGAMQIIRKVFPEDTFTNICEAHP